MSFLAIAKLAWDFVGKNLWLLPALAMLALWMYSSHLRGELREAEAALEQSEARHAITRQSVETLQRALAEKNQESQRRAEKYQDSLKIWAEERSRNEKAKQESIITIQKLVEEAMRDEESCPVPDHIKRLAEGL